MRGVEEELGYDGWRDTGERTAGGRFGDGFNGLRGYHCGLF